MISLEYKEKIKKTSEFLLSHGYIQKEREYSIDYISEKVEISINLYPIYDEEDVNIRFNEQKESFPLSWLALVRYGLKGGDNKSEKILKLIKLLQENYRQLSDYHFCKESEKLINQYIEEHKEEFVEKNKIFLKDIRKISCNYEGEARIPFKERLVLRNKGSFLEKKGYKKIESRCMIEYRSENIIIDICYELDTRMSPASTSCIRFTKEDELFFVDWIMKVKTNRKLVAGRFERDKELLNYICENYDTLIQYDFCKECDKDLWQ